MTNVNVTSNTREWKNVHTGKWCQCLTNKPCEYNHPMSNCRLDIDNVDVVCGLNKFISPEQYLHMRMSDTTYDLNVLEKYVIIKKQHKKMYK